jgi:hypothetical protein
MVHALSEIRRTLIPDGLLLDLRPLADRWPVEVVTGTRVRVTGCLTDLPTGLADDEASNRAMQEAARRGWFVRADEQIFPAFIYWDDPDEMSAYMAERWADFVKLEDETLAATRAAWEEAGEGKQARIRAKMLLTRWRKISVLEHARF